MADPFDPTADQRDPFTTGLYEEEDGFAPSTPDRKNDPFDFSAPEPEAEPEAPPKRPKEQKEGEPQPEQEELDDPFDFSPQEEQPEPDRSLWEEFTTGLSRGIDTTQAMGYGLLALGGDATGWDWLRDKGAEGFARNMQQASQNATSVTFSEADSPGDYIRWASGGLGELSPTIASMIATGGAAAVGARSLLPTLGKAAAKRTIAKGLTKELGEKAIRETSEETLNQMANRALWNMGSTVGAFANSAGLNTGEVYGNFIDPETGEISDTASRSGRIFGSIGGGLLAGALDTAVPATVLRRIGTITQGRIPNSASLAREAVEKVKGGGPAASAATRLLLLGGGEGTTEAMQELISETVGVTIDEAKEWDWEEFKPQLIEAFALGTLGGSVMGGGLEGAGALVNRQRRKGEEKKRNVFRDSLITTAARREVQRELGDVRFTELTPDQRAQAIQEKKDIIEERIRKNESLDKPLSETITEGEDTGLNAAIRQEETLEREQFARDESLPGEEAPVAAPETETQTEGTVDEGTQEAQPVRQQVQGTQRQAVAPATFAGLSEGGEATYTLNESVGGMSQGASVTGSQLSQMGYAEPPRVRARTTVPTEPGTRSDPIANAMVDSGFAQSVELVGSRAEGTQQEESDTDLLVDLGTVENLPEDSREAAEFVESMIEDGDTGVSVGERDYFFKANDRYFHLDSGAGTQLVENTEYAREQEGRPKVLLANRVPETTPLTQREENTQLNAQRIDNGTMNKLFMNLVGNANAWGIHLLLQPPSSESASPFFQNVGGIYNPSNRSISLIMSDTLEPSMTDVIDLLHEMLHDFYANQSPQVQQALLDWVKGIPEGQSAQAVSPLVRDWRITPDNPANLTESLLNEEMLVEELAQRGLQRTQAEGIVANFIRALKDFFYRAALYMMDKVVPNAVSPSLARAYAENRVAAIIAGQPMTSSLLDIFGGGKPTTPGQTIRYRGIGNGSAFSEKLNTLTGEWEFSPVEVESVDDAMINVMAPLYARQTSQNLNDGGTSEIGGEMAAARLNESTMGADNEFARMTQRGLEDVRESNQRADDFTRSRMRDEAAREIALQNAIRKEFGEVVKKYADARDISITKAWEDHGMKDPVAFKEEFYARVLETLKLAGDPAPDPKIGYQEELTTIEDLAKSDNPASASMFYVDFEKRLAAARSNTATRIKEEREALASAELTLDKNWERMEELESGVKDMKKLEADIKRQLIELRDAAIDSQNRAVGQSFVEGDLAAQADALNKQLSLYMEERRLAPKRVEQLLSKIYVNEKNEPIPLMLILNRMMSLTKDDNYTPFPWATATKDEVIAKLRSEMQANTDDPLGYLLYGPANDKANALLPVLLSYIKRNEEYALAAQRQAESNEERAAVVNQIKSTAWVDSTEAIREMEAKAHRSGITESQIRFLSRYWKLKQEMNAAKKAKHTLPDKIKLLEEDYKYAERVQFQYNKEMGMSFDIEITDEMKIPVPSSPEQPWSEMIQDMKELNLKTDGSPREQLGRWLKRIQNWIGERKGTEEEHTPQMLYMRNLFEKLSKFTIDDATYAADNTIITRLLGDWGSRAMASGTRAGRLLQQMVLEADTVYKTHWNVTRKLASEFGGQFSLVNKMAKKIAGMQPRDVYEKLYNRVNGRLNIERELSGEAAWEAALDVAREDPQAAKVLQSPEFREEFRKLIDIAYENSDAFYQILEKNGVYVKDEDLKIPNPLKPNEEIKVYRHGVQRGIRMMPRMVKKKVVEISNYFRKQYKGALTTDGEYALLWKPTEEALQDGTFTQLWNRLFGTDAATSEYYERVVEPMIDNDMQSTLPHPAAITELNEIAREQGAEAVQDAKGLTVETNVARRLWRENEGDMASFIQALGRYYEAPDLTIYAQAVMTHLNQRLHKVNTLAKDAHERDVDVEGGRVSPQWGTTARVDEDFPSSLIDFELFSKEDNQARMATVGARIAFGENLRDAKNMAIVMQNDIQSQSGDYQFELNKVTKEMPDANFMQINREMKKRLGAKKYKRLKKAYKADKNGIYKAGSITDGLKNMIRPRGALTWDMKLPEILFGTMISGFVAGPKTAIVNNSSNIVGSTLFTGTYSKYNALEPMYGFLETARSVTSTLLTVVGLDVRDRFYIGTQENAYYRQAASIGFLDHASNLTPRENVANPGFRGRYMLGEATSLEHKLRIFNDFFNTSPLRVFNWNKKTGEEAIGPRATTLKANMMASTQINTTIYPAISILRQLRPIVMKAKNFLAENPGATNADLTAENLGMKNRWWGFDNESYFNSVVKALAEMRLTLEDLAHDAAARQNQDSIFTDDTVRRVAAYGIVNISQESAMSSRPGMIMQSPLGRISGALLGWSLDNAFSAWQIATGTRQTGHKDLRGAMAGMKAIMFHMLPASLLFALFFDWWDEDVVGKKSNLAPWPEDADPEMVMRYMADRFARVGTFGMAGQIGSSILSMNEGEKLFSLDERLVWVNSLIQLQRSLSTVIATEGYKQPDNLTYNQFWRPITNSLGASGVMQNVQIVNNLFDFNNAEARTTRRINVNNYLRAVGRQLKLDVRTFTGGVSLPNPVTPHMTNMGLAAMSDDYDLFMESYEKAIRERMKYEDQSRPDAVEYVKRSYKARHPLRMVFRTAPSEKEYQKILDNLSEEGRQDVTEAIGLYNRYGKFIDVSPYYGSGGGRSKKNPEPEGLEEQPRRSMSEILSSSMDDIYS